MRKTALVTGGTRGIGLAVSRVLAQNGFDVAVNGIREAADVSQALHSLEETGAQVIYCRGDISQSGGREAILEAVKQKFGELHLLVNNAGVAPLQRLDPLEMTEESYDRVMNINLKAPFFLTRDVARYMAEQVKNNSSFPGKIINIGSISADVVSVNRAEYCISKAGFAMHSRIWAARLGEYGIPVYEVRPGVIRTDMTSAVTEKYDRLIGEGLNIQPRWGETGDVAAAVLSLATGHFPFSTGSVFMVDGGLTVQRL